MYKEVLLICSALFAAQASKSVTKEDQMYDNERDARVSVLRAISYDFWLLFSMKYYWKNICYISWNDKKKNPVQIVTVTIYQIHLFLWLNDVLLALAVQVCQQHTHIVQIVSDFRVSISDES